MQATLVLPEPPEASAEIEPPFTVREAFAFRRELNETYFGDVFVELLREVRFEGGGGRSHDESNPDWTRYTLRLKCVLMQLCEAGLINEEDVESIFLELTS